MNQPAARPSEAAHTPIPDRAEPETVGQTRQAVALRLSLSLIVAGILTQITYPLLSGELLRLATVVSVLLLAGGAVLHAGAVRGLRGLLAVPTVAGGLGLAFEALGVHTGFPFGSYAYADTLGAQVVGVPLIVPLAWTMLAYPCLLLGRRLARSLVAGEFVRGGERVLTAVLGGVALAGWDLYLDPQMVAQGHWSWTNPEPALPGVPGVPLTNYAGWLLVAVVMIAALDLALPRSQDQDRVRTGSSERTPIANELIPAAVLAWTWVGSAVGNLVFFDRPWVALYGGLVMGTVVLPYLLLVRAATVSSTSIRAKDIK